MARSLLTTISKLFMRFGSHGDCHLCSHPNGPTSPVEGRCAHHQSLVCCCICIRAASVEALAHPAAHYHIHGPPLQRLAGGLGYKRLFYRVSSLRRC